MGYTKNKIAKIFARNANESADLLHKADLLLGEKYNKPILEKSPDILEKIGFLSKPSKPMVVSLFVTKGGVLKTSLTLNIARMAALHNIKTCVIGLDMQGDITTALGHQQNLESATQLQEALDIINEVQGLSDVFYENLPLESVLVSTDLPTLKLIPETPELVALEQGLIHKNRREAWLKDFIIAPLKSHFDLILLDCSPNWNQLITNALVASDVLISPLECKINNFRNFKMFDTFIKEFKRDLNINFNQIFVPTRFSANRKLSKEIRSWYLENLNQCTSTAVRECIQGEEAMAMHIALPEYAPNTEPAYEMNQLLTELWQYISPVQKDNKITNRKLQQLELTI